MTCLPAVRVVTCVSAKLPEFFRKFAEEEHVVCNLTPEQLCRGGLPTSNRWVCKLAYSSHNLTSLLLVDKTHPKYRLKQSSDKIAGRSSSEKTPTTRSSLDDMSDTIPPLPDITTGAEYLTLTSTNSFCPWREIKRFAGERSAHPSHSNNTVLKRFKGSGHSQVELVKNSALNRNIVRKTARTKVELEYLVNELCVLQRIPPHPCIPVLISYNIYSDCSGGELYFEVAGDLTLYYAVTAKKSFNACAVIKDVTSALHHIWKHGFVHMDIKSTNIVLKEDLAGAVLVDFGLASTTEMSQETRRVIGFTDGYSPGYVSPQIICGSAGTHTDDIWALGLVAAEAFGGVVNPIMQKDAVSIDNRAKIDLSRLAELAIIFAVLGRPEPRNDWPQWVSVFPEFAGEGSLISLFKEEGGVYTPMQENFIGECLSLNANQRLHASSLIHHPCFK